MRDLGALTKGMEGSEVVFHVAALFKLWGKQADFEEINVGGMRTLIGAASDALSVKKIVAVSAAAVVMGDPEPMLQIEETIDIQVRRFAPYSSSKAQAEQILLAANGRRAGLETISIRPPMIWGAGMPMLDQLVDTVHAGRWQWVDNGTQTLSTCHVSNLVEALILSADKGRGGQAYFVADADDDTFKNFISALLATRNVSVSDKSVPFGVAWIMAGIMGGIWRTFRIKGEPPITRQMLRLIGKSFTIRWSKANRDFGYLPLITRADGLAEMCLGTQK
jgi:nucleoside-diphosphate-sugar epimerase